MLSSQTKDEVTDAAVSKLRTALGGSLSIQGMIDTEEDVIAEAIAKVGFWRRKTGSVNSLCFPFLLSFPTLSWNADKNLGQISQKSSSQASWRIWFWRAQNRGWTLFSPRRWSKNGFFNFADSMEFVSHKHYNLSHSKKQKTRLILFLSHRNHGIGVDVHVHRITNLLGWHKPPTKNPEQTR